MTSRHDWFYHNSVHQHTGVDTENKSTKCCPWHNRKFSFYFKIIFLIHNSPRFPSRKTLMHLGRWLFCWPVDLCIVHFSLQERWEQFRIIKMTVTIVVFIPFTSIIFPRWLWNTCRNNNMNLLLSISSIQAFDSILMERLSFIFSRTTVEFGKFDRKIWECIVPL